MNKIDYLTDILHSFKIKADCVAQRKVRNISLYDIKLKPGTLVKTFDKYANEISIALLAKSKPFIRVVSNQGIIRMEVVEDAPSKIDFYDEMDKMTRPEGKLPIWLGSSIEGESIWMDLAKNPHTLIAGCTGSGKSVLLHTMIANLLQAPAIKIFCVDTKNIEFCEYASRLRNLTVVESYNDAYSILKLISSEMDRRYLAMKKNPIIQYPSIVFMIDEYADLVSQDTNREFALTLCKLAQKSRAAGIYCVVATQRPSVDVINGSIKANFPARIACQVVSGADSKIILDHTGAEKLIGSGDAIVKNYNNDYRRVQIPFTTPKDILHYHRYSN